MVSKRKLLYLNNKVVLKENITRDKVTREQ